MRLIDADLLHSKLFEIGCHKSKLHPMDVMNIINEHPTAYDIDKVVEELESFAKLAENRYKNNTSPHALQEHRCWVKAAEIVKHGGRKE